MGLELDKITLFYFNIFSIFKKKEEFILKVTFKGLFTIAIISATVFLSSCTTLRTQYTTNEISSEKIALNTYFDKNEYSIIGTAYGESDFVYYDTSLALYKGDSMKYGYIYEPTAVNVGDKVFVGTGKKLLGANSETETLRRAKLNANYALIQDAYSQGGDFILEPIYTVEMISDEKTNNGAETYKVTVKAKVIRLNTK